MVERYVPVADVEINGVRRTLLGGNTTGDIEGMTATATLALAIDEGVPTPGDRVRVRAGYAPRAYVVFTGEIDRNGITLSPNDLTIQCSGYMARTREPIGAPPDIVATLSGDTSEQDPVVTYAGATAGAIVGDILDRYGVPAYDLEDSGATWGNLEPIGLMPGDGGESLIRALDEDEFYRTADFPDGTIRRVPWLKVPGAGAAREWVEGSDLYAGSLEESRLGVRNRIIVTGLPQKGTTGVSFVPTGIAEGSSAYVPSPPTYRALVHNSALLEDGDRCQEWAETKYGEVNRLVHEVPVSLMLGDPTLQLGMTVSLTSAKLGIDSSARFLVKQLRHTFDQGFNTDCVLWLIGEGGGYNPNLAPIAIVDAKCHLEYLADGTAQYEVALDGSASYDPELGTAGIVSYVWTGTPATPTPHGVGQTATVAYSGSIPAGATVTLTVTDNLGRHGTATIPITASAVPVTVRDLIAALLVKLEVSRDGQKTWQEVRHAGAPIAAIGTCEIAAETYTFAWDAAGKLYKVLATSTSAEEVTPAGASVTACWIGGTADGKGNDRVWAGCADGRVFFSPDAGASWEARAAAPNGASVAHISESIYAEGDLMLGAGGSAYHSFSAAAGWDLVYTHPNTALSVGRIAGGFGQTWIGYAGPAGADSGASRLRERDGAVSLGLPPGGYPALAIVGLAFDVFEQTLYVADNEASDAYHGRLWTANTATSGNLTPRTYDYVLYGPLRHLIRDGGMAGLVYLASKNNLLKSIDGLATVQNMRNLTGGREGMMIGYGAEHAPIVVTVSGDFLYIGYQPGSSGTEYRVVRLTADGWEIGGTVPLAARFLDERDYYGLLRLQSGALIAWSWSPFSNSGRAAQRSTDNGDTWGAMSGLDMIADLWQADDGSLWAWGNLDGTARTGQIVTSSDDGATWGIVSEHAYLSGSYTEYTRYAVDLANPARQVLQHRTGIAVSTDGGATFGAVLTGLGPLQDALGSLAEPIVARGNRWTEYSSGGSSGNGLYGGTIAPATGSLRDAHAFRQFLPLNDGKIYALQPNAYTYASADDGSTWAAVAEFAGAVGLTADGATGDRYAMWSAHSGNPASGTAAGLVQRQAGGAGALEDLTQAQYDALGALYWPYWGAVTK